MTATAVVCLGVAWTLGYLRHALATDYSTATHDYSEATITPDLSNETFGLRNITWLFGKRPRNNFASFSNAVFRNIIIGVIGVVVVAAFYGGRHLYRKSHPPAATSANPRGVASPAAAVPASTGVVLSPPSTNAPTGTNTFSQFGPSTIQYSNNNFLSNYSNVYSNVS